MVTNLERFDSNGIELIINTTTGESFASKRGYARMAEKDESTIRRRLKAVCKNSIITAQIPTAGGLQVTDLIPMDLVINWLLSDKPSLLPNLINTIQKSTGKIYHVPKSKVIKPNKPRKGFIYLIQVGELDIVKIGYSNNPIKRLNDLQISHYETLSIIATKRGNREKELHLHKKFKDDHIRGEWFRFSDNIKIEFDLPVNLSQYSQKH